MFHETTGARTAQTTASPAAEAPARPARRRGTPILIGAALIGTLVAFGIGVTAQSRAEARIIELDQRIHGLQLELEERRDAAAELSARVGRRSAENDDRRAALDSTEGFLD